MNATQIEIDSQASEMMVVGSMLTSSYAFEFAAKNLLASHFHSPANMFIFSTLQLMHEDGRPADVHLLSQELKSKNLLDRVGGVSYLIQVAQFAGTSAYIEEYVQELKNFACKRRITELLQIANSTANSEMSSILKEMQEEIGGLQRSIGSPLRIRGIAALLLEHGAYLDQFRGEKYLGLCQKFIPALDDMLLGLRKLILLAAAPNVGKTALVTQLGLSVLLNEPTACMVFFSLEMPATDILTRMKCYLAEINHRTLMFGSQKQDRGEDPQAYFTEEERESIQRAEDKLLEIGDRLQIVDSSMCPHLNAQQAISYIQELQAQTGCSRVIVVIDYLQVWPITEKLPIQSEIEADKWRIGQIKQIRDALKDDPVIVISEARKPSGSSANKWGGDLSDIMGSARGAYTPDAAILYMPIDLEDLSAQWSENGLPQPRIGCKTEKEKGEKIRDHLASQGMGVYRLEIAKGRDGMERGHFYLVFHFRRNAFNVLDWRALKNQEKQKLLHTNKDW